MNTLKRTKNGKAAGSNKVGPELLKADMELTATKLAILYNRILIMERWPKVWKKALIVKICKKGSLCDCHNWRGVTLLPIISKVFCRMLIECIKSGVDKKLRKEQADFRPKRSTVEQIFIMRNILEQANDCYVHALHQLQKSIRFCNTEKVYGTSW